MLGLIVGLAVAAVTIIVADLLRNDEIFDKDMGQQTGNGRISPYERIAGLSCDTEAAFTDADRSRADIAVREMKGLLGENPAERLGSMDAGERLEAAKELHRRLCTAFSLDISLEMGQSDVGCVGTYCPGRRGLWVDYRYLLSDKAEYIADYLDTIIHEFRHAMQHRFLEDGSYNGVDDDYRKRIAVSMHPSVYVNFDENPELYYNQLCEKDARAYAAMVLQQLKGAESNG